MAIPTADAEFSNMVLKWPCSLGPYQVKEGGNQTTYQLCGSGAVSTAVPKLRRA